MADTKNPSEKPAGEQPEGKYHYNPGNQSAQRGNMIVPLNRGDLDVAIGRSS